MIVRVLRGGVLLLALHLIALSVAVAAGHLDRSPRRQLAYYTHRRGVGHIVLVDINRGLSVSLLRHDPYVVSMAWSPDGQLLVYVSRFMNVSGLATLAGGEDQQRRRLESGLAARLIGPADLADDGPRGLNWNL